MPRFEFVWRKRCIGKIAQIARNINFGSADNRRRQYVPVIRVGQRQRCDQIFIANHHGILRVRIHGITQCTQSIRRNMRLVPQHRVDSFGVYMGRPTRLIEFLKCQSHEQITQGNRVEDARVQKGAKRPIHSGQTEFLIDARHLIENRAARAVMLIPVGDDILEHGTAMRADTI